jgi:mono/diheme cytochrome c family protein
MSAHLQENIGKFHMFGINYLRLIIAAILLTAAAFAANAQEAPGDLRAGQALAWRVCSPCHAVEPNPKTQRLLDIAPDFQVIADTPGMTATALNAFLHTSHPKMPNFILSSEASADVIAYILSLRGQARPEENRP